MARERQKTLMFGSEGKAEIPMQNHAPSPHGRTLKPPSLTARAAEAVLKGTACALEDQYASDIWRIEEPESGEDNEFMTNSTIEELLGILPDDKKRITGVEIKTKNDDPQDNEPPDEDDMVASRPAMLDLAPYEPPSIQPTPEIQQERVRIGNKARIAIAIGVGAVIGLAGTALYSEYRNTQGQKPHTETPVPEKNGL